MEQLKLRTSDSKEELENNFIKLTSILHMKGVARSHPRHLHPSLSSVIEGLGRALSSRENCKN